VIAILLAASLIAAPTQRVCDLDLLTEALEIGAEFVCDAGPPGDWGGGGCGCCDDFLDPSPYEQCMGSGGGHVGGSYNEEMLRRMDRARRYREIMRICGRVAK